MDSTVTSRPNHYETLGLEPSASADDIAEAYARELRRPSTIGQIARVGIAYEVLRDPTRRQAYDRSIGLAKEPEAPLLQWPAGSPFRAPYMRTARAAPAEAKPAVTTPPAPSPAEPQSLPDAPSVQRLPSFLATAIRDIARPEPLQGPVAAPQPEGSTSPPAKTADETARPSPREPAMIPDEVEDGAFDWRRIGIGAAALVAVAGLFGVWAGTEASDDIQAPPQKTVAKAMLPPATPFPESLAKQASAEPAIAPAMRPAPSAARATSIARILHNERPAEPLEEQPSGAIDPAATELTASDPLAPAAEQPPRELVTAAVKAASMPLPNRVIARTIDRIGYSCGQVTATDAVEGQAGVFRVSCTSGHSFQARPVGGRYRFKRLSR